MSKNSRTSDFRRTDSKRSPNGKHRDQSRKAARRAKYALQGRSR